MKRTIDSKVLTLAVLLGATATSFNATAQDFGGDDVFNSDQIDIDGVYQKKESAADRIEKMRKQLERKNEEMVQKKIEDIRINQEKKLANQLQDAFNGNGSVGSDEVSTVQAAPQRVVAPEPMPLPVEEVKEEKKTRVIPGFGVSQFNGEGIDGLESDPVLNLAVESMVSDRFAVGVGLNYTKMDITYYRDYNNGLSPFYSTYLQGDDVSYKNLNININGKLFLSTDATVKPFIGLGLGYNRTTLAFEERTKQSALGSTTGNNNLKETSVTGTGATGMGMIGAEFAFNETIGMTADFRFTKALTNGFSDGSKSFTPNTQEALEKASLKRLGYDLDNSDIASLNLGLLIKF